MREIIEHINSKISEIGLFPIRFGLCEIIKRTLDETSTSFPAEFCSGEYTQVSDFERGGTVYHRLTGDITSTEADEESSVSCDPFIERTYPMRTVGVVPKNENSATQDSKIAELLARKISFSNNKALRQAINADSVSIEIKSISTDRNKIWEEEYSNIPMSIPFESIYLAIDYNIIITGNNSCFPEYECGSDTPPNLCPTITEIDGGDSEGEFETINGLLDACTS